MSVKKMKLSELHVAKMIQPRGDELNNATVKEYAEAAKRGDKFPPLIAYNVTDRKYPGPVIVAGFHRIAAYKLAEMESADVDLRTGTYAEAWLAGYQSNLTNGLRYTNEQKRNAVSTALLLFRKDSANMVADRLGVSHTFVQKVRAELVKVGKIEAPKTVTTKDGREHPAQTGALATVASAPESHPENPGIFDSVGEHPENPELVNQSGDTGGGKSTDEQAKPAKMLDGWGIELQEHAIEPFQAVPEFDALIKYLKAAQKMLTALADKPGGRFLQKRCQWYRTGKDEDGKDKGRWRMPELDNAIRNIEDTKPTYTTCPYAHNPEKQHPDDCTACRGAYWCPPLSKQIPANLIENAKRDLGALIVEAPSV